MLVAVLVTITFFLGRNPVKTIDESDALATCSDAFAANIRSRMNGDDVIITVGGGSTEEFGYTFYVSDNMALGWWKASSCAVCFCVPCSDTRMELS